MKKIFVVRIVAGNAVCLPLCLSLSSPCLFDGQLLHICPAENSACLTVLFGQVSVAGE